MSARPRRGALAAFVAALFVPMLLSGGAIAAIPAEGAIGPTSGSAAAWDFAPVGPGVSLGGTTETTGACAPTKE